MQCTIYNENAKKRISQIYASILYYTFISRLLCITAAKNKFSCLSLYAIITAFLIQFKMTVIKKAKMNNLNKTKNPSPLLTKPVIIDFIDKASLHLLILITYLTLR